MSRILFVVGNWCFRTYVRNMGRDGAAGALIGTLAMLRNYAELECLDFPAAVISSRRRGSEDRTTDREGFR